MSRWRMWTDCYYAINMFQVEQSLYKMSMATYKYLLQINTIDRYAQAYINRRSHRRSYHLVHSQRGVTGLLTNYYIVLQCHQFICTKRQSINRLKSINLIPDHFRLNPDAVHLFDFVLERSRHYPMLLDRAQAFELYVLDVHLEHSSASAGDVFHLDLLGLQMGKWKRF